MSNTPAANQARPHAARYLAAYAEQGGKARTVGCRMTWSYRFIPKAAFAGIPAGINWVEAGKIAAERTLAH